MTLAGFLKRRNPGISILLVLLFSTISNTFASDHTRFNAQLSEGFEYCNEAQQALLENNLNKANALIQQYLRIKKSIANINNSAQVLEADNIQVNLRYCARVQSDIEVANAQPVLEQAFASCTEANHAFSRGEFELSEELLSDFNADKNQALAIAPALIEHFQTRRKISACEKLGSELKAEQQAQRQLLETFQQLLSTAEKIDAQCKQLTDDYESQTGIDLDFSTLQAQSDQLVLRTQKLKEQLLEFSSKSLKTAPLEHRVRTILTSSNQCISNLQTDLVSKKNEAELIEQELQTYQASLDRSLEQCKTLQASPPDEVTETQYKLAKETYEAAVNLRNSVQSALTQNWHFQHRKNWPPIKSISASIARLNGCLETARVALAQLYEAVPKSVPALPSIASTNDGLTGVPAKTIQGTIRLLEANVPFAIVYLIDGSRPSPEVSITIDSNGFEQVVYTAGSGDTFSLLNKDRKTHQVSGQMVAGDWQAILASLPPGQRSSSLISWPVNNIVRLSTDDPGVNPAYLANIQSNNYQVLIFEFGSTRQTFKLNNAQEATRGFLLIPGLNPTEFNVTQGNIKSLVIYQQQEPKGNLLVKGL